MRTLVWCAAWALFALSVPLWLPVLGSVLSLTAPLPFVFAALLRDRRIALRLTLVVAGGIVILASLTDQPELFIFSAEYGVLGLVLGTLLRGRVGFTRAVMATTALTVVLSLGFLGMWAGWERQAVGDVIRAYLTAQLTAAHFLVQGAQTTTGGGMEAGLPAEWQPVLNLVVGIFPALLIVGNGFCVWLNSVLAKQLLRARLPVALAGSLGRWRAPENLVWILIAAGFVSVFFSGAARLLGINALIVLAAVYFFNGLAVVVFLLNKYRVARWLRWVIYLAIVFQQALAIVLALLGLFEQWLDLRRLQRAETREE